MFGFLVLNKPKGISSRTALDKVVWPLKPHKVGHAGTLDPLATGVLVACTGPATRLVSFVQQMPKLYRARFRLGFRSETEDVDSALIPCALASNITREQLANALPQFVGKIWQRPPAYSALRIRGQRSYKLARSGQVVELASREIMVHRLELTDFTGSEFELQIQCGSGTYVRSLGRDIAESLATCAVMTELERTGVGPFCIERSLSLGNEPVRDARTLVSHLISPVDALQKGLGMAKVVLTEKEANDLRHGRRLKIEDDRLPIMQIGTEDQNWMLGVDKDQKLLALLKGEPQWRPFIPAAINFSSYWQKLDDR